MDFSRLTQKASADAERLQAIYAPYIVVDRTEYGYDDAIGLLSRKTYDLSSSCKNCMYEVISRHTQGKEPVGENVACPYCGVVGKVFYGTAIRAQVLHAANQLHESSRQLTLSPQNTLPDPCFSINTDPT